MLNRISWKTTCTRFARVLAPAAVLLLGGCMMAPMMGAMMMGGHRGGSHDGNHDGNRANLFASAAPQVHMGQGMVDALDPGRGIVAITHGPIPSLQWPAMSMEFRVKDKAMLAGVKKGQEVEIEITQSTPGEFTIVRMAPAGAAGHQGH